MEEFNRRWWHLAAIQMGGAICLPIFVVGHAMAEKYGLLSSLISVALGNGMLLILGVVAAHYAVKTRMNTAEAAADAFGSKGKLYFSLMLILSMMGWFSIQLDLMGVMAGKILGYEASKTMNMALGVVITLAGLKGFRGMEWLAKICLPLLVLTIGYAVYNASQAANPKMIDEAFTLSGVSLVLAAALAAVIDMPTFFRQAKGSQDALIATVLLFAVALPLLEGVGIYLAKQGAGENLAEALADEHSSPLWKAWVAFFIILAGWTTNNTNLYSAATSLKSALKLRRETWVQVTLGLGGTLLSLFDWVHNLPLFLEYIGVMLASAGGVMLMHQMASGNTSKLGNAIGLIAGSLSGVLSSMEVQKLSGLGIVDAFGLSFLLSVIGTGIKAYKKNNQKVKNIYETCGN